MDEVANNTLADQVLEDALNAEHRDDPGHRGAEGDAGSVDLPSPPPQQATRQGGLQPLIDRKKKEIKALEDKLLNPEGSGAYTRTNEHGNQIFDYVEMQRDQVRLNQMRDQLTELRDRDRHQQQTTQQRNEQARRTARSFLAAELQRMPENLKRPIAEAFGQIFQAMERQGSFAKPDMADQNTLKGVLNQVFDTAYGSALRRSGATPGQSPAPSGFSEGDEAPQKQEEGENEDPFTQNLMYAYDRKRQGRMTVAQMKRQEREAAKKEASQ